MDNVDLSAGFAWISDYDVIMNDIASTELVNVEWSKLRDMIKYKINQNISLYLSEGGNPQPISSASSSYSPKPTPSGGIKLPPFPLRDPSSNFNEAPKTYMTQEEADETKSYIFAQLHEFEQSPPFTIQRVCELCIEPQKYYKSIGKYLRAIERALLVTSTMDAFPPLPERDPTASLTASISMGGLTATAPSTPLFSPIPFLHGDARRSKSHSPPPSPLSLTAVDSLSLTSDGTAGSRSTMQRAIGLVDELDDPSPGHMSDHPMALSATTTETNGFLPSLEERFVKAERTNGDEMDIDDKGNKG